MRDHPIPPVSEPLQYRAIGLVRGIYEPEDPQCFTRGSLIDDQGDKIEAVVLGRVMSLMKHHLPMDIPHLWVVYPRCRDQNHLHLQISGIWEPSTLGNAVKEQDKLETANKSPQDLLDKVLEGDNYFSIRGELIYTNTNEEELVIKVRQRSKENGPRPIPFKIRLKGSIPIDYLRNFVSLDVRRNGQTLVLENYEAIAPMPTRGGKRKNKGLTVKDRK